MQIKAQTQKNTRKCKQETHIQNNFNRGYSNSNLKLTNISKL